MRSTECTSIIFKNTKRKRIPKGIKHQVSSLPTPSEYWVRHTKKTGKTRNCKAAKYVKVIQDPKGFVQWNMVWDPRRLQPSQGKSIEEICWNGFAIFPCAKIRISANQFLAFIVDRYIEEVKRIWPLSEFGYREELALFYLYLNNYDIIRTLFSVLYNVDELRFLYRSKLNPLILNPINACFV